MKYALMCILGLVTIRPIQEPQPHFFIRLADSATTLVRQKVRYDPKYYVIPYPNGDVPQGKGVCTDVVIRAYRKLGIDLQQQVIEDMKKQYSLYPKKWGQKRPDPNIDHRRVLNLMVFFNRKKAGLPITPHAKDYQPGDVVCWDLGGGLTHIGLVTRQRCPDHEHFLVVHNIGQGQVLEDMLFDYPIIGHYRYQPNKR